MLFGLRRLLAFGRYWASPLVGLRRLLAFGRYWASALGGLWRLLGFGVNIRVICVICGLFLICSVFHFVCCLGYGVYWLLGVIWLRR